MFFYDDFIYRIEELNKKTKYHKITSVYGCLPSSAGVSCGFEQIRVTEDSNADSAEKFFQHVKRAQDAGLEFIYLLNSPKTMSNAEFQHSFERCNRFLELLLKNNIRIVRVTNTQLMEHISNLYKEIEIRTSTSQEYASIRQYRNLFIKFPNITEIIPSHDLNRNFSFLKSFKMCFDKRIELMANEGCLPGCPFRYHHALQIPTGRDSEKIFGPDDPMCFKFTDLCSYVFYSDPWRNIVMSNTIYPWQIETYAKKYGITKFKLVGRNVPKDQYINGDYFEMYNLYIRGAEDYDYIADKKFRYFNIYFISNSNHPNFELTVSQVKDYLPDISYFEKNGGKCANICGAECKYCFSLAERLNHKYPFNMH